MQNKIRIILLSSLLVLVLALGVQAKITLKLAHAHTPEESIIGHAATYFAQRVAELTNGEVQVDVYHSGQAGADEREMAESVQFGALDMAIPATSPLTAWNEKLMLFDLPFLFEDHAHAIRVFDGPVGDHIKAEMLKSGIRILEIWSAGFRNVFNNVRPIYEPDDLKGIKIRVMQTPVYLDTFTNLGALPTAMASSELFTALQLGVVDAGENDPGSFIGWGWVDVAKYYSFTQHAFSPMALIINAKRFDSLSESHQMAICLAAREASQVQRQYVEKLWGNAVQKAKDKGVLFNEVNDISAFRNLVLDVYDKYRDKLGYLIDYALAEGNGPRSVEEYLSKAK
jgi:tripartite ATP-independent transporter DctP family solute receptor